MEGTAWQVGRATAAPHGKRSQQLLRSSPRTHLRPAAVHRAPAPRRSMEGTAAAASGGGDDGRWGVGWGLSRARRSHVVFPSERPTGLRLRSGFSAFGCPRSCRAVSPGAAPTASGRNGMAVPRLPPLSLAFTGAGDLLCASIINLSGADGYSSSRRRALGTGVDEPVCHSAAADECFMGYLLCCDAEVPLEFRHC